MDKEYAKFLLEKIKKDYDLIADDFSRTRKNPWWEISFLFDNYLNKGDKVLDLGCGNGRNLPLFKKNKVDYFGADSSKKLIEIAREKYPKEKFKVDDGLSLKFPNDFFDKIYSIAVLHQIPSEKLRFKFLNRANKVLKSKGLFILTVWHLHRFEETSSLIKYTFLKLIGKSDLDFKDIFLPWGKILKRYYHCFTRNELEKLLKKAGFKIIKSGIIKNEKGNRQNIYIVSEKN